MVASEGPGRSPRGVRATGLLFSLEKKGLGGGWQACLHLWHLAQPS